MDLNVVESPRNPAGKESIEDDVRRQLRTVGYPGFGGDVVSWGFIKGVEVAGNDLTIHFAPNSRDDAKVALMESDIRASITEMAVFSKVTIDRSVPFADEPKVGADPKLNPLQAELLADGQPVGPDMLQEALSKPDIAHGAGYAEGGPAPLSGPGARESGPETYDGPVPVFQWEIDPRDHGAKGGETSVQLGEWDIGVWWQHHTSGLVYVSMQAVREDWQDHDGAARAHPVGRSEAVNLVYDGDREAVVAIYGSVRDFRPFVEAFRHAILEGSK